MPSQGHQLREPSWCSSANQSGPQQLPTAAPPTPSMTKHSPEGPQGRHTHAQLDVETLAFASAVGRSTESARPRCSTAAALHAAPAGLLRLKRQWRPISRQLRLSDSDDSDSLSDFNSIDDFHTERGQGLQSGQQAAACCLEPVVCKGRGGGDLAVGPAISAEALQPAIRIQPSESGGRAGTSLYMDTLASGLILTSSVLAASDTAPMFTTSVQVSMHKYSSAAVAQCINATMRDLVQPDMQHDLAWHIIAQHCTSCLMLRSQIYSEPGPNAGKQISQTMCSMHAELYAAAVRQWCKSLHCSSKTNLLGVTLRSCLLYTQLDLRPYSSHDLVLYLLCRVFHAPAAAARHSDPCQHAPPSQCTLPQRPALPATTAASG